METFLKYFLPVYYILFLGLAFILPPYRVWKATKVNPYKLGNSDSVHDYIGKNFRLILFALALVIFLFAFSPDVYKHLLSFPLFSKPVFVWVGLTCLFLTFFWILIAQFQMQKSWRIGIDEDVRTELVQTGLFTISRNPIFLGMRVLLLGIFLVLPNAATCTILITGELLIQIQVRLEEDFLTRMHGDSYRAYQKQVHRWI